MQNDSNKTQQPRNEGAKSGKRSAKRGGKGRTSVFGALVRNAILAASLLVIIIVVVNLLLAIITRHGQNKDVPNFVGSTLVEAERMAQGGKLEIIVNDSLYVPMYAGGVILEQRPSAGKDKVKSGRKVYVTINASRQRSVEVPFVAGYSLRQAKSNLVAAGLEIERLEYVPDLANNYVLSQKYMGQEMSPDSVVMAPLGSKITLVVGRDGNNPEVVPNLEGMTLREVKHALWDKGFNLGAVEFEGAPDMAAQNAARVFLQSPAADSEARQGGAVSVRLRPNDGSDGPTEQLQNPQQLK